MDDWISLYKNALDADACAQLIEIYERSGSKAFTRVGLGTRSDNRRGTKVVLTPENSGELLPRIQQKLTDCYEDYAKRYEVLKNQQAAMETIAIYKYADESEFYGWHTDAADAGIRYRFVSIVGYLNDVESGGETEFRYIDRKVPPRAGNVLLFPSGWTHYHQALPPESGSKYVLITWLRYASVPPL